MKNTIILLSSKILEKLILFVFYILFARNFSEEIFGEFSYYFSISYILYILIDLGGEFYQTRILTQNENIKVFNAIVLLKTILMILVCFVTYLYFDNIYILLLLFSFYLESVISLFRSSFYKNSLFIESAYLSIYEKIFFLSLQLVNIFTLKNLLFLYVIFSLSKVLYIWLTISKYYKKRYLSFKTLDFNFIKKYFVGSLSYILHSFLVAVFVQIDIIMLKSMDVSFQQIAIYSAAVKIILTAMVLPQILFNQYYPVVAKLYMEKQGEKLKLLLYDVQKINIYLSGIFAILIALFSYEIVFYTFGEKYIESSKLIMLFSIILLFRFSMYTYTATLSASEYNYVKIYTSIVCVLTNIGLNIWLIPIYGIYGALFATILTELLLVVLYKVSNVKIIGIKMFDFNEILLFASVVGILVIYYFNFDLQTRLVLAFFLVLLLILTVKKQKSLLNFRDNYIKEKK